MSKHETHMLRSTTTIKDNYVHTTEFHSHQGAVVQWSSWQSIGLVTERLQVRLTPGPLQATLSKLLTYCVLRPTQPPTLSGTGNEQ